MIGFKLQRLGLVMEPQDGPERRPFSDFLLAGVKIVQCLKRFEQNTRVKSTLVNRRRRSFEAQQ